MKLEHIAPYLPYGLKFLHEGIKGKSQTYEWTLVPSNLLIALEGSRNKPILRPLSDLTKEITHNGETFVPMDRLEIDSSQVQFRELTGYIIVVPDVCNEFIYASDVYDNIFKKLFEWQFDVFGLLGRGEAIDIKYE